MFNWHSQSGTAIKAAALPMLAACLDGSTPRKKSYSQLGGQPCWPKGIAYPLDREGHPLMLLAQISFAETPRLAPIHDAGLL